MSGFTRRISGAQAVRNCLSSLGIAFKGNVSESLDPNVVLMWFLATRAGQRLLDAYDWQVLDRDYTIVTVAGQSVYPLPPDFNKFKADASWNRTTRLPAIGSLTEQEWQMLKARQLEGTTFTMLYRISDDSVEFYDLPAQAQTIVLPYASRGWVLQSSGLLSDNLEQEPDTVLYDRQLFEARLRLEWDTEKRFDTTAATNAYNELLNAAKVKDAPSRTLTLRQGASYPYLGTINIADTGYGNG